MHTEKISPLLLNMIRQAQKDEETGAVIYAFMAKREKNPENRALLIQMAADEKDHAQIWGAYTGETLSINRSKIIWFKLLTIILGFTFTIKRLEKDEETAQDTYERMLEVIPEARQSLDDERRHEAELSSMLDEERLHYVGAMVLGLNDALVELTGAIAGITFALANTHLVALTGIITGVSATLSMAASNYLAERANGNLNAFKSSLYTGVAYLVTVALMVLPYLLFPNHLYGAAFACMIGIVILIILFFNYYISVAKEEPFFRRFGEMALISLSVAAIAFIIGIAAKSLLGIET